MRQGIFKLCFFVSVIATLFASSFSLVALMHLIGGRDWTAHIGEDHWQTYVCLLGASVVTGLLGWPIFRFWHKRILK